MGSDVGMSVDTALAELERAGFSRGLTDHEARMEHDFNNAELHVAQACAPVVKKMLAQLIDEANTSIATRDFSGIASLSASYVAELATTMRNAGLPALGAGQTQIHEWSAAGDNDVRKRKLDDAIAHLLGVARLRAQTIADKLTLLVRNAATRRMRLGDFELGEDDLSGLTDSSVAYTVTASVMFGREAMTLGRMVALAALVALATEAEPSQAVEPDQSTAAPEAPEPYSVITSLTRTAALDENLCGHCQQHHGDIYSDTDPRAVGPLLAGLSAVPDPECEGTLGDNICRCAMIPS